MDTTFIQEQIDVIKAQMAAYNAALTALATGAVESYTLDTGQTRQTVTKLDISKIKNILDSLWNRYSTLYARLYGGSVLVRPQW